MGNIEKELEEFLEFKKHYNFIQKKLVEKDGSLYCDGYLVSNDLEKVSESDSWINAGYNLKGLSCNLSNLYPYEFTFRGKKLSSIESFFQGIKFPDKDIQNYVFSYFGVAAVNVRNITDYDWTVTNTLYFDGNSIDRMSKEYDDIIDELYISAVQNPLYRMALLKCDKDIIHSIGKESKEETTFTRYEFEKEINCLKDFVKSKSLVKKIK